MKDKQKIVVMGGSFNPPTLAHYTLMLNAIDTLNAHKGIFVPVSDAYLRRKMRHSHPPVVLSPEARVSMLRSMCTDSRMTVCEMELDTVEARTVPTLTALQEEYPDACIYFIMGADKLELLIHLTKKRKFLDLFSVALYSRDNTEVCDTLKNSDTLSQYMHRIMLLPQPEGTNDISSSKARELMLAGKSCQDMLCTGVWQLFKGYKPSDFPDVVDRFKDEYSFLSNRHACRIVWNGLQYANAEAAFQSSRCAEESLRKTFCGCSADKAAMKGRETVPPDGWESERVDIMESVLRAKFEQNKDLMERLLDTGDKLLINGNSKGETFWGVDLYSWRGENTLGKILMAIRDKEREKK